jgi:transposase
MAYDNSLKILVIKYRDAGHTFSEVYEAFGVDAKRYHAWKKEFEETGTFRTHYPASHAGKIDPDTLRRLREEHPDWYYSQFAKVFGVSAQAIQKRFAKMKITRKKKLLPTAKSQGKSGRNT